MTCELTSIGGVLERALDGAGARAVGPLVVRVARRGRESADVCGTAALAVRRDRSFAAESTTSERTVRLVAGGTLHVFRGFFPSFNGVGGLRDDLFSANDQLKVEIVEEKLMKTARFKALKKEQLLLLV